MNSRFLKYVFVLVLGLTLGASACRAAYGPPPVVPVSWVLSTQHNDDVDEKRVVLIGRITHHDNGSDWWFTDGTGSVRLETGDQMPPVGPMLRIVGRIDQATWGIGVIEVKVKHWAYAKQPAPAPPGQ
jgi:uncharacterized protein YdeI (BOF family)